MSWNAAKTDYRERDRLLDAVRESGISAEELFDLLKSKDFTRNPDDNVTGNHSESDDDYGNLRRSMLSSSAKTPPSRRHAAPDDGFDGEEDLGEIAAALSRLMDRRDNQQRSPAPARSRSSEERRRDYYEAEQPVSRRPRERAQQREEQVRRSAGPKDQTPRSRRIGSVMEALNALDSRLDQLSSNASAQRSRPSEKRVQPERAESRYSRTEQYERRERPAPSRAAPEKGVPNEHEFSRILRELNRSTGSEAALAELRQEITEMKEVLAGSDLQNSLGTLESKYKDISQRLGVLAERDVDPKIYSSLAARLRELEGFLQQLPRLDQLEALDTRITQMGQRLETLVNQSGESGLAVVRDDIEKLRSVVSKMDANKMIHEVDKRIRFMVARMDELEHFSSIQKDIQSRLTTVETRLPDADMLDQLQGRLEEITGLLAEDQQKSNRDANQLDRVEQFMEHIDDRLEHLASTGLKAGDEAFQAIESRLEKICDKIGSLEGHVANQPEEISLSAGDQAMLMRMEGRIRELATSIEEGLKQGASAESVDELREQLHDLRVQVAGLATAEDMELQLQDLASSLSRSTNDCDDKALDQIEQQIRELAVKLDVTKDQLDSFSGLGDIVYNVDRQLQEVREDVRESARLAAQQAVEAATRNPAHSDEWLDPDSLDQSIQELRSDLQSLLDSASENSRSNHDGFLTVQDVLGGIADRLTALEERRPVIGDTHLSREHENIVGDDEARGFLSSITRSHLRSKTGAAEKRSYENEAAEQPKQDRDRKADFIAAARRAAQAAAAEAASELGDEHLVSQPQSKGPDRAKRLRDYLNAHKDESGDEKTADAEPSKKRKRDKHADANLGGLSADEATSAKNIAERIVKGMRPEEAIEAEEGPAPNKKRRAIIMAAAAILLTIGTLQVFKSGILSSSSDSANVVAERSISVTENVDAVSGDMGVAGANDVAIAPPHRGPFERPSQDELPAEILFGDITGMGPSPTADTVNGQLSSVDAEGSAYAEMLSADALPLPDGQNYLGEGNDQPLPSGNTAVAEVDEPTGSVVDAPEALAAAAVPVESTQSIPEVASQSTTLASLSEEVGDELPEIILPKVPRAESTYPPEAIGSSALRDAAANGDASAQFVVGVRFTEGEILPANLELAAQWYRKAAAQGLAPAQYRLGSLYEKGRGVDRDREQARDWYSLAAAQGNIKAMHNLAVMFAEGITGAPNFEEAYRWFEIAARHGVADSNYNLGILSARGLGVQKNLLEAYKWFALAAEQGDQDAAAKRDEVAGMLVKEDLNEARSLFENFKRQPVDEVANKVEIRDEWQAPIRSVSHNASGDILKVQQMLSLLGYDTGRPDGHMGPKTEGAIRAFQQRAGLKVTGNVDNTLLRALAGRSI
ncbi:hypothetical protein E1162_16290 [Rhodobacteraceae bacterium RKSG542]|uniref:peptidoglycan-binding protein n=1 Tax=Pseudovibrio flavus TaxID=2529854 RepID=UPI0012BB7BB3|nr:peptidoglycan-binding protein [Pseudovibrio flavus]MTI18807.1 hypothetical protein [Pseudovibrio flavus]